MYRLPAACCLAAVTVLALGAEGRGAIVYLTQQREIRTLAFVRGQPEGGPFLAPDFGDWSRSHTETFSENSGSASSSQTSRLLPDQILMDGTASATVNASAQIEIDSRSEFHITFRLDAQSPYLIEHGHSTTATPVNSPAIRLARAVLMGPGGTVFDWREDLNVPNTWPAAPVTGSLPAGNYDLLVQAYNARTTLAPLSTGTVSVSFHMTIPAPGGTGVMGFTALAWAGRRRREVP